MYTCPSLTTALADCGTVDCLSRNHAFFINDSEREKKLEQIGDNLQNSKK